MYSDFSLEIYNQAKRILKDHPQVSFQSFMTQLSDYFSIESHTQECCEQSNNIKEKYLAIQKKYEIDKLHPKHKALTIHIIGAGPAGLLLARALLNIPINIHVYEKRNKRQSTTRLQMIGIRYAKQLSKILDKDEIKELLNHGGQYNACADIIRVPIAALQLCLKRVLQNKVTFHYSAKVCPIKLGQSLDNQTNLIVISGGKGMKKDISSLFEHKSFPEYQSICRYTWLLNSTEDDHFSNKLLYFSHGPKWVRAFRTNTNKDALLNYYQHYKYHSDIDRTSELLMKALKKSSGPYVSLTTIISTDKTNFNFCNPIASQDIKVVPSISEKQINRHTSTGDMPYILLGDITGQTHPLSLSGMIKIVRVIPSLKSFILNYINYWKLKDHAPRIESEKYKNLIESEFEKTALAMQKYVFFKTLVCTLYEKAALTAPQKQE